MTTTAADTVPTVTDEHIRQARTALGRQLAQWRASAGLTQAVFAERMSYSRSAIANVEVGRQGIPRAFWERADRALFADGALLIAFDELDALCRTKYAQAAWAIAAVQTCGLSDQSDDAARTCGCSVTVAMWGWRETRALREALRLPLRAFAERLGVAVATAAKWEDRRCPTPPSLAMQALLDEALKLADADARARFIVLVRMPRPVHIVDQRAQAKQGAAPVIPLQRSAS